MSLPSYMVMCQETFLQSLAAWRHHSLDNITEWGEKARALRTLYYLWYYLGY